MKDLNAELMKILTEGVTERSMDTAQDGEGWKYFLHYVKDWEKTTMDGEHIIYRCKDVGPVIAIIMSELSECCFNNRVHKEEYQGFKIQIELINGMVTNIEQYHTSEKNCKHRIESELVQLLPMMARYYITGERPREDMKLREGEFRAVQVDCPYVIGEFHYGVNYTSCYMCGAVDTKDGFIHGNDQPKSHWE